MYAPCCSFRSVLRLLATAAILASPIGAGAQTPFVPYFGKNRIQYDTFKWHIYTTDRFEIYYSPEVEAHLERVSRKGTGLWWCS